MVARDSALSRLILATSIAVLAVAVGSLAQFPSYATELDRETRALLGRPILEGGEIAYTYYNRLLFPAFYAGLMNLAPSLNAAHTFVALRFVAFLGCFYLIFSSIDRRAPKVGLDSQTVCLVTGISFVISLGRHPSAVPSDIFDLTIMYFAFVFVCEERLGLAFLLALLATINRESGPFVGVAYFILNVGRRGLPRVISISLLCIGIPYGIVAIIRRLVFHGPPPTNISGNTFTGVLENAGTMFHDLLGFNPTNVPYILIPMLALPALMLSQRHMDRGVRLRVSLAFLAIFLITLEFGLVREIRIFLPGVSLLIAASVTSFRPTAFEGIPYRS
jgi:hypothetical protein